MEDSEELKKPFLVASTCGSTSDKQHKSTESDEMTEIGLWQKLKSYPPTVFYMLGNEFCERFSFYGMKALLTIYFISEHGYSNSQATLLYHLFACLAYIFPLVGSILADSYLGRFKVIFYGSMVYVLGHVFMSIGAIPMLSSSTRTVLDFTALFTIAIATGAIKPCVSAFAADQFSENQQHLRAQFFSFFYFCINAGSLFAIFLTPILKGRIPCFGSERCFPLAFGVPGVLMLVALLFFLLGWNKYKKYPPSKENLMFAIFGCIGVGAKRSLIKKDKKEVNHWLDRSSPDYSNQMIEAVKGFLNICLIFSPLVFFWALFDQQGSTWVLQATLMDGQIGWFQATPEQINILNPLLVLFLVPLFEGVIYPVARKFIKITPLRKMACGGLLAALSFVMAGILQIEINKTLEPLPSDGHVFLHRFGNASDVHDLIDMNGNMILAGQIPEGKTEIPVGMYSIDAGNTKFQLNFTENRQGYVVGVFLLNNGSTSLIHFPYDTSKTKEGRSKVYISSPGGDMSKTVYVLDKSGEVYTKCAFKAGEELNIQPFFFGSPDFTIKIGSNCNGDDCPISIPFQLAMGGAQVLHVFDDKYEFHTLVRPNSVSMLWVIPQYFVITTGEVLLSVTGLEFAYSQSAPFMKSVLQAMWLLTVFMGNLIDIGISGSHIIPEPATEFFVYALLMAIVMAVFILLAIKYTYVDQPEQAEALEEKERVSSEDTTC